MRKLSTWFAIGALLATGGTVLIAGETPAVPAPAPATRPAHVGKLTKPWSELPDLTPEQKAQIIAIHDQADADRDVITRKEHADIEAVLTDDQKKEIVEIQAKARAEAAAKKKKNQPTTNPAS